MNAGGWNQTLGPAPGSFGATISDFVAGDELQFNVTTGAGVSFFRLDSVPGTDVLGFGAPGSGSYTVAAPHTAFRTVNQGFVNSITITATCTPAPATSDPTPSAARSQAAIENFLVIRINGILLNDPGSTSLLQRGRGQSAPTTAATPGSAPGIAGAGTGFGNAMALGAGRFDDAGAFHDAGAAAMGPQTIRFAGSLSQLRRDTASALMVKERMALGGKERMTLGGKERMALGGKERMALGEKERMALGEKERMALGAGDGGALPSAYETYPPWDLWVEGRYSAFDDLNREGHVGVLYLGGDYRVTRNMVVGALVQFDWSRDSSDAQASKVDGSGWMAGPYFSARIHDNVYLDLRAAWGRSSNDLTLDTTTADFDTSRWLVKGTLSGNWVQDAWRLTPSAGLAYVEESADAFTNSAGTFVPGQDVSLGRLQFGPEVGYRIRHTSDAFIEPFAAIHGVWDFDNPNSAGGPGDFWGRMVGGLTALVTNGVTVRVSASWDGVGASDYSGYTLQGTVSIPLN